MTIINSPFTSTRTAEDNRPLVAPPISVRWTTPTGEQCQSHGEIEDFTTSGAALRLADFIDVGQTVWLTYDLVDYRMAVSHCERRGTNHLVILRLVVDERRREDRLGVSGTATLVYSNGRSTAVRVKNLSSKGAQIELLGPLPPTEGSRVILLGNKWTCRGVARHCRREKDEFVVGVQFTERPCFRNGPVR